MVYFHSSISVCNSVDQSQTESMANPVNSNDLHPKSRQSSLQRNKKVPNSPICEKSQFAVVDVVILIAVIAALGFLVFPYAKFVSLKSSELIGFAFCLVKDEIFRAPMIYGSIGLSFFCAAILSWVVFVLLCTTRKCRNPKCKGLRKKSAEFDIQLETEECVKNSSSMRNDGGVKKGLFELPRDHHKELEAELKKMAPVNGRAVLIFRARCGCSVGRLEVPGPKKQQRKIKK